MMELSRVLEMSYILSWVLFKCAEIHQTLHLRFILYTHSCTLLYITQIFKIKGKKQCCLLSAYCVPGKVLSM